MVSFMDEELDYDLDGRLAGEVLPTNELVEYDFREDVPINPKNKVVLIKGYNFSIPGWTVIQVIDKDIARGMFWVLIERQAIDFERDFI